MVGPGKPGRPRKDPNERRDQMTPKDRGYRQLYLTKEAGEKLDDYQKQRGCPTWQDALMDAISVARKALSE